MPADPLQPAVTAARVVIIGGGALGLAAALQLTELGADVTLLERSQLASESSGRSAGIIETQFLDPLQIELRAWSMRFFRRLETEYGLGVVRNGYLRIARREQEMNRFLASVEMQRDAGIADARVLEPADLSELVPDYSGDGVVGGLFGPGDGYIDGHQYCMLLAEMARSNGAIIETAATVTEISSRPTGGFEVHASNGTLAADVVVNAAGAWAGQVGALCNAPVAVLPQRHQAALAHLPRPLSYVPPSVMDYVPQSGEYGFYFRDDGPARLLAGLHTDEPIHDNVDPDDYRRGVDEAFLEQLAARLVRQLPSLADATLDHGWAGLYPVSPDGLPQVGPHASAPGVFSVGAAGGGGISLSPVLGRLVAEWVATGSPTVISESCVAALLPEREPAA